LGVLFILPFANKTHLTDEDLLHCNWILRESDSGHRQTFDRAMQGLLPKLKIRAELTQQTYGCPINMSYGCPINMLFIHVQHNVIIIAHHRIGTNVDCINIVSEIQSTACDDQSFDPLHDLLHTNKHGEHNVRSSDKRRGIEGYLGRSCL